MLCQLCQNIRFEPIFAYKDHFPVSELPKPAAMRTSWRGPFYYPHHRSRSDLIASAEAGCHLCAQIWFAWGGTLIQVPKFGRFWLDYRLLESENIPRAIRISSSRETDYYTVYLNVMLPDALTAPLTVSDPMFDTSTGSEDNLRLAKKWLSDCLETHTECAAYQEFSVIMPTRVIDVVSSELCLHITHGEISEYAILSHCWGKHRVEVTTSANVEARCSKLPMTELSKTFQDAVTVTRALGLRYLWIDSMCILQDSPGDWQTESSRMGKYYAGARITIAATDAVDGSVGCFSKRNPLMIQGCKINMQFNGDQRTTSIITSQIPEHQSKTGENNRTPRHQSTLDSRAWCLQEAIMSSRMLNFGEFRMSWRCLTRRVFEGDTETTKKNPSFEPLQAEFFKTMFDLQQILNLYGPKRKNNIWFDIIEQYTQRNLTFASDTLPGLSGLAAEIQALTGDVYLGGLWKSDIARSLLWRTPNQSIMNEQQKSRLERDDPRRIPPSTRASLYRAPSWSWASVDHCFANFDHVRDLSTVDNQKISGADDDEDKHAKTCFELIAENVVYSGYNALGELETASLEVRGKVRVADVWPWSEDDEEYERYIDDPNLLDPETKDLIGRVDSDDSQWQERPVYCFPVLRVIDKGAMEETTEILCLALLAVEEVTNMEIRGSKFNRIGVAVISDTDWFEECKESVFTLV